MPFKSEAQRRYLWANEPEIARDWTDTYGSRVQKNNGGIMDIASDGEVIDRFKNYKKGNQVTVPTSFQARSHSTPVKLAYITDDEAGILQSLKSGVPHDGPMHIPNYNDYDPDRGAYGTSTSGAQMSGMETGSTGRNEQGRADARSLGMTQQDVQNIRSGAIAAGAGQTVNPGLFGPRHRPGISKQDLGAAKAFAPQAYRATRGSPFGIGNLFRGAMSMFGGWPGRIGSMLSHINPNQLRGKNPDGSWRTQGEWEGARNKRRYQKRLDNLYRRKNLGKGFSQDNIDMIEAMGYSPYTAQNVDSGRSSGIRNIDVPRMDTHDFEDVDFTPGNFNYQGIVDPSSPEFSGGITEIDINEETKEDLYPDINSYMAKSDIAPEFQHLIQNVNGNYSQNAVAGQLFGSNFGTLTPFQQGQVNDAIDAYGTTSTGTIKSIDI